MVSNVEEAGESSRKPKKNQYDCEVICPDGTVIKAFVDKSAKGEVLFKQIIDDLRITSKEYAGLCFKNDSKTWLDIHKDLKHQIGDEKAEFYFRVKFYEPEPAKLKDEYIRYLLYMQVCEDLHDKRLVCPDEINVRLGSYTAQVELGDFNLSEHGHDYLKGYDFAENNDEAEKVKAYHKKLRGQTPAEAELNFLEIAKRIPKYGVDFHKATDSDGPVELGIAALGINVYRNGERKLLFRWQDMRDFLYNRRKFTVKLKEPVNDKRTHVYYFDSAKLCKQCYKTAVEYHTFFRLTRPDAPRKRLDSMKLRSSFRYSDRTLYQLRHQNLDNGPNQPAEFKRTPSKRRTLPPSYKAPLQEPEVPYVAPVKDVVPKKVDEEPIQYEEIEIDEANPEDDKYDPKEWETVEKTLPDGTTRRYRRRIILVVKTAPTKKSSVDEEPIEYEEVPIDEANPDDDKYDPKEWEVIEKVDNDGLRKRYRRRIVVIKFVKKPEELVNESEVTVEEMPIDEQNPDEEDGKYDPDEWEVVEKLDDDGKVKKYRRRIFIVKIVRKSDEEPVNEDECKIEEVEFDESNPDDELYDPDEWETIERSRSDGTTKKYRRRLYVIKVVKKPSLENEDGVHYEEEEITEENPSDPEKYDPEEWEELVKTQPDGTVKRFRRRVVVVKIVRGDGGKSPVDEQPIQVEEIEVDENSPEYLDALDDPEFEVIHRKKPDGTIVRVKRRIVRVTVIRRSGTGKEEIQEEPIEYEEAEIDENSPDFEEALNDPEFEIVQKKKPDGTIISVKRRVMRVTVHRPARITITSHPRKEEPVKVDEEELSYEEIEVDENSPVHFDKNVWEEYEKIQPDGSVKKYRRRYISKCNVILKKPSIDKNAVNYEEVDLDNNDEPYDPNEWEVIEKEQPDGTKKRVRRRIITTTVTTTYTTTRYVVTNDGEEQTLMETKPIESTQTITVVDGRPIGTSEEKDVTNDSLSPVEMNMSMDDLINEINEMSISLDDQPQSTNRVPIVETETITVQPTSEVESAVELPFDEEEEKKRLEKERLEQEGLNATIDSIFTLPDDDEVKTPLSRQSFYDEDAYNESFDHELDEYGIDVNLGEPAEGEEFDFSLPDPSKPKPKTKPKPRKAPKPAPRQSSKTSQSSRTSGSDTDDTAERKRSNAGEDQPDYLPSHTIKSEIIYTVTDVSQVEQGSGGFVKSVRAKHEHIAHELEHSNSPRNSKIFESPPNTPKGHVPTRTVSFNENDKAEIVKTTEPPSVPANPVTIVPAESELPEEDFIFPTNQSPEESHPDIEQVTIEAADIPEVETEVIMIEPIAEDNARVAPPGSEPGRVRTRPFMLPRQDTQVIKTEIIEVDLTPGQMESFHEDEESGELSMSTEQLPTEVITKTITIEGDSTNLTAEEIEKLLSQAPEEVGDLENFTTTQVVRTTTVQKTITGKTLTITGDGDEEEIRRMLDEAVTNETTRTVDEDGNVIITAVRDEIVEVDDNKDDTEI